MNPKKRYCNGSFSTELENLNEVEMPYLGTYIRGRSSELRNPRQLFSSLRNKGMMSFPS